MSERFGTNDPIYDASRLLSFSTAQASTDDAITDLSGDVTATGPGAVTATLATVNANVGTFGSATQVAQVTVNGKGLVTAAANVTISGVTPAAHDIAGALHTTSGRTAGQVLQATGATTFGWSTNTLSIAGNSTINGSLVGNITGGGTLATGGFTLTIPATGTAALLQVANTFTVGPQTVNTGADSNKGIIVKQNSATQSANLLEFSDSAGTGFTAFSGSGNLRIGSATVRDAASLEITRTITSAASAPTLVYYYGFISSITSQPSSNTVAGWRSYGVSLANTARGTSNITSGFIYGAEFLAQSAQTAGTIGFAIGGGFAVNTLNPSGTTTITSAVAGDFAISHSAAGSSVMTTARLLRVSKPSVSAGTLTGTTLYGIDIGDMNGANSGTWTNRYAVNSAGGRWVLANTADEVLLSLSGYASQSATTSLATLTRNDALTNAIGTVLTLGQNSTGTAAAGFGGSISLQLESSTTADQAAAAIKWLWTNATHSVKTSRVDVETTGPGKCAAWGYSGIDGTARYIINNGTGDVTEGVTVQYVASEITGTDSYGGIVYLEPSDSFVICTDGTNTLTITCATDGSLYVQRSSGTDTFKFSCWAVWQ